MSKRSQCLLYARFSPRPDELDCDSSAKQLADMRRWCEERGYEVLLERQDDAMSGADHDRAGLAEVLQVAKRGEIVVVRDFKRLSRDTHHRLGIALDLKHRGVRLVSITEGEYQADNPEWMLLFRILAAMGEYERETTARATSRKMRHHQRQGRLMGGVPPYGYRIGAPKRVERGGVIVEHKTIEIDPVEHPWINRICAWHALGNSASRIAALLTEAGAPARPNRVTGQPGRWSHKSVQRILARES